ncbi:MAG: aminotransferase class I/II-fold pyridoxal phosphate-dependent enzyme, partial [Pirellulaceae bacterium]
MSERWIADRTRLFDNSGIRKVFDLARSLPDPINLSIGQPDFEVPEPVRRSCIEAIEAGKNGYSLSQGIPPLREKIQQQVDQQYGHTDRTVLISSGTSGGLLLAMLALVNPGDEVIIFDPFFVMYEPLVQLVGGTPVLIDTYPDFTIDVNRVEDAITDRTKMILLNSPANPTGVTASEEEVRSLAELAARHNIVLVSDEIYRQFCYDEPFSSPASFNDQALVIDGFSKSHAMTDWRLGMVHGPAKIIDTMIKLQQYTFVCAPQPAQWAGLAALDVAITAQVDRYRRKRDMIVTELADDFEIVKPGGAFYVFPRAPVASGSEFVMRAIENNLLIIPGTMFSNRDTHFR